MILWAHLVKTVTFISHCLISAVGIPILIASIPFLILVAAFMFAGEWFLRKKHGA